MSIPFIDLKAQQARLMPSIKARMDAVLAHGRYIMGPEVGELEQQLQSYTKAPHCITVASGTEALLIALMAIGIKAGDEVITTPFTFVATAEVIALLGAVPVFVDIEADTCNINANLIEQAVSEKTKAIIPVSLYGQPADMDEINALAEKHNFVVIEDSAQSFGSTYKTKKSGNISTISCTSFFPSKPLGCYGDGGAMFTNNDEIAKIAKEIRVHGQSARYVHDRIGVGGRMDTLQCAVVLAKLEQFDWEVQKRLKIGEIYNNAMDNAGIERVQQRADRTSVFAQYTILVNDRAKVQEALNAVKIPTAVHYPIPLNEQRAYKDISRSVRDDQSSNHATPVAQLIAKRVLSLPMGPDLDHETQQKIIIELKKSIHS